MSMTTQRAMTPWIRKALARCEFPCYRRQTDPMLDLEDAIADALDAWFWGGASERETLDELQSIRVAIRTRAIRSSTDRSMMTWDKLPPYQERGETQ